MRPRRQPMRGRRNCGTCWSAWRRSGARLHRRAVAAAAARDRAVERRRCRSRRWNSRGCGSRPVWAPTSKCSRRSRTSRPRARRSRRSRAQLAQAIARALGACRTAARGARAELGRRRRFRSRLSPSRWASPPTRFGAGPTCGTPSASSPRSSRRSTPRGRTSIPRSGWPVRSAWSRFRWQDSCSRALQLLEREPQSAPGCSIARSCARTSSIQIGASGAGGLTYESRVLGALQEVEDR